MAYPQQPYSQTMFQQPSSYYQGGYFQQLNNNPIGLRGRPVSSIDEVRASMIDFDGTTFYFPDTAKKSIYTKKMNLDGTSSLEVYRLVETPIEPVATSTKEMNFVTQDVFQKTIQDIVSQLNSLKKGEVINDSAKSNEQFNF